MSMITEVSLSSSREANGFWLLTQHRANYITLGQAIVMNSSGIPQDEVSRFSTDLDCLTTSLLEPPDFFWGKSKPVGWAPSLSLRVMSLEEGLVECTRSLHDDETSVLGTIWCKVEDPLNALQSFPERTLIDVRPRSDGLPVFHWKGQVSTVE